MEDTVIYEKSRAGRWVILTSIVPFEVLVMMPVETKLCPDCTMSPLNPLDQGVSGTDGVWPLCKGRRRGGSREQISGVAQWH